MYNTERLIMVKSWVLGPWPSLAAAPDEHMFVSVSSTVVLYSAVFRAAPGGYWVVTLPTGSLGGMGTTAFETVPGTERHLRWCYDAAGVTVLTTWPAGLRTQRDMHRFESRASRILRFLTSLRERFIYLKTFSGGTWDALPACAKLQIMPISAFCG